MDKTNNNRLIELESKIARIEQTLANHQHTAGDGTNMLRKNIMLDRDQWLSIGTAQHLTDLQNNGLASERYVYAVSVGPDTQTNGFANKSNNMQLNFLHSPRGTQSFLQCYRKPLATSVAGSSISTTAAGNTVTITGFAFVTNELAGGLINIFDSSGALVETQTIASNTSTVVTISGTWANSTSGGTFLIYRPVFLGSAEAIFQRNYVQEGTVGGLRFGVGPTAGGQNGLLYMDATGDLYWRSKAGVATKLN